MTGKKRIIILSFSLITAAGLGYKVGWAQTSAETASEVSQKAEPKKLVSTESFKAKLEELKAKVEKAVAHQEKIKPVQTPRAEEVKIEEKSSFSSRKVTLPDISKEDETAEGEIISVQGVVVARNNYGMAVETSFKQKDGASEEIWFVYNNKLRVSGFKSLAELGEGDRVAVKYKLTKKEKKIILSEIKLVSKKPKQADNVLVAEEVPEASV